MDQKARAKELLSQVNCVVIKDGREYLGTKKGVSPLLEFIDSGVDLRGGIAADRIVGKAAALLYVKMGVSFVYAKVMGRSAMRVFDNAKIEYEYGEMTDFIKGRNGVCPMEAAVADTDDPDLAVEKLTRAVEAMRASRQ